MLKHYIVTKQVPGFYSKPVGMTFLSEFLVACSVEADGAYLPTALYPELYSVMGDVYCPRTIPVPMGSIKAFMKRLGFSVAARHKDSPSYRAGYFRVPDCRSPEQVAKKD